MPDVSEQVNTIRFPGEMILLGTGTSVGVPAIGCGCSVCTSSHPRNQRTRCSAVFGLPEGNLLIDTSPELRMQLLRERVGIIHSVLYTHEHADHLHGLDDIRLFPFMLGHAIPIYATPHVSARIRHVFDYAFSTREHTHSGAAPSLVLHEIDETRSFQLLGSTIQPVPLIHGPYCHVMGYRVGNVAYCTDTNQIVDSSRELLQGLDTLVLDALRFKPHPTHFCIDQAVELIDELKPRRAFLTHLSHDVEYETVESQLPENVHLAYDGLRIPLT